MTFNSHSQQLQSCLQYWESYISYAAGQRECVTQPEHTSVQKQNIDWKGERGDPHHLTCHQETTGWTKIRNTLTSQDHLHRQWKGEQQPQGDHSSNQELGYGDTHHNSISRGSIISSWDHISTPCKYSFALRTMHRHSRVCRNSCPGAW